MDLVTEDINIFSSIQFSSPVSFLPMWLQISSPYDRIFIFLCRYF